MHVRGLQCAQQAGSSLKWPHSLSVTTRAAGEPGAEEVSSIADSQREEGCVQGREARMRERAKMICKIKIRLFGK